MVKPAGKKNVVDFLKTDKKFSQNRSCRLVKLEVSTYRYKSVKKDDTELREKIIFLAHKNNKYGSKRIHETLKQEGEIINHKKVLRIYNEEHLALKRKKRRNAL